MPAPGRFIVVEGGDGAGKGSLIVTLLLADSGAVWTPHAELLLMVAARIQHVTRIIRPAIAAGQIVLCDRYVGSTLAYQGGGRGLSQALILALHRDLVADFWPDLTLLLDVDPEIALARSRARLAQQPGIDEGRFEALDLAFHHRVRATYTRLAQTLPAWTTLDASQPQAAVARAAGVALGVWEK